MSTSQLRNIATGQVAEKPKDIASLLASANVQAQIKNALPRHMTPERMARIATTEMRKVPKLMQCDPLSFLGAVIQCAQLGLEPGSALGHAYILPFDKREKVGNEWKVVGTEAQVIIGYRGMIDLARRSGQIISIEARAVYEGDVFDCVLGLESKIEHTPDWHNPNRANAATLRFVYAVAKLKGGGVQFDIMSRPEIDAIMNRSQGYKSAVTSAKRYNKAVDSPWTTDYSAMALKTVVRRLFKYLPVSVEMQTAVGLDEQAEVGISQQNRAVIDGNFTEISDFGDDTPALENNPGEVVDFSTGEIGEREAVPVAATGAKDNAAAAEQKTFAQVEEALRTAKDRKVLDQHAKAIVMVRDDLQADLRRVYDARLTELGSAA